MREGTFRLDLYYRLKGVVLELPALKERRVDIPYLVRHFTERFTGERKRVFSPDGLRLLATYNWPGNIRELENFVRSILLFVDGDEIGPEDIRQFDEFFAEGEMSDEPPRLEFANSWWSLKPIVDPLAEETEEHGAKIAHVVRGDRRGDKKSTASAKRSLIPSTKSPIESVGEEKGEGSEDPELAIVDQVIREGLSLQELKKRLETECIRRALIETEGNITHAAKILQMKRPRLSQIINANPALGELKASFGR